MILVKVQTKLMGNQFEFLALSANEKLGNEQIACGIDEVKRIERLLTTYSDDSITNEVNRNAGIKPVEVPDEFFNLVYRAQKISTLTQGYFDLSYGSLDKNFWNFNESMTKLPSMQEAKKSVHLIDYRNILLDNNAKTVFLKNKGMRIGFGGIGKGYAADCAKRVMLEAGVNDGIVSASGDLNAWGYQEDGSPWTVGIANPNLKQTYFPTLNITNKSIATSGNYEKFVMIDNQLYSHTINPKTGYPIKGIKSVTIITSNAELADAMATPVSILGVNQGLNLINQLNGIECILVDDNNKLFLSKNIKIVE
ncbi:thiamine biosynthesis lipoprotein [Bacteroides luti]|uniref:FAD:protein FMN transferase n=1 Tax=Bacteroides luti TaxID=1297750 RepID=A0A1M5DQQ2_9BACE|nr:FAD:protein FMN transferase [Bacteroides luti]SHF69246.1 thiamine biosynthesis lipoprotein [Bacteroides luti]